MKKAAEMKIQEDLKIKQEEEAEELAEETI